MIYYTYIYIYMCVCVFICMYICMIIHICICTYYVYIYIIIYHYITYIHQCILHVYCMCANGYVVTTACTYSSQMVPILTTISAQDPHTAGVQRNRAMSASCPWNAETDHNNTHIIWEHQGPYPIDNLGFTGYQPYRPPTEPYERACGNLLKDGWRGQQWQYVLIRRTRRCTSCRRAVKFFTEFWYWWKWCLRTETNTSQTSSGCTERKAIYNSTSSTRRSRQHTWKTEIVHPTIVASDDSEG